MSVYQQFIREDMATLRLTGRHDPAVIEAYMRLKYRTLDHLSPVVFRAEVALASHLADAALTIDNVALAASYGLRCTKEVRCAR